MVTPHVLIVEPDRECRSSLLHHLLEEHMQVAEASSIREASSVLEREELDLVFLALRLPDGSGLDLLSRIVSSAPATPVVVITAYSSVPSAVEAMKRGAFDYLAKPVSAEELLVTLRKALETRRLRREMTRITQENVARYGLDAIVGQSPAIHSLRDQIGKLAKTPAGTILIQGESGTGKDLVAKAIHYSSSRAQGPFVPINCSAIPETLLESELFGHESGAFTDARLSKRGLFEVSSGGTVFLDEVAELGHGLQAKLLRFLEDRTFRRVGGTRDIAVDVRVVAATNVNLKDAVAEGRYREDLYYRLQVEPVTVPPLRDRVEDIPLLARSFVEHFNRRFRKRFEGLSPEALRRLCSYAWPGNVRELKNAIERVMILEDGPTIEAGILVLSDEWPVARRSAEPPAAAEAAEECLSLEEIELKAVMRALERARGNQSHAARLLGISRDKLRHWVRKHCLAIETRVVRTRTQGTESIARAVVPARVRDVP
ncbi:MAG: sigma-54-dependent Fis family transcriptional regulator [Planctomycetes bacterium]|nr:sigma-54-dependent Fis family transcriptional regulator [Planctomycetota bacterium]